MFNYLRKLLIGVPIHNPEVMISIRDELADIKKVIKEQFHYYNSNVKYPAVAPVMGLNDSSSQNDSTLEDVMTPEWMDKQQVMTYLKISDSTYLRLKKKGVLVPKTIGRRDYYFKEDLDKSFGIRDPGTKFRV